MQLGNPINEIGPDDGEVRHPNLLHVPLLDDRQRLQLLVIPWVLKSHLLKEDEIDLLKVSLLEYK